MQGIGKLQPEYYDEIWSRRRDPGILNTARRRMEYGAQYTMGSVLDLGCGMGQLADAVGEREYMGVDFSRAGIEWARANIRNPNARFLRADLREPPILNSYDTVAMFEFLEHLIDPASVAELALRLARQRVIVSVPVNMVGPEHVKGRWEHDDLAALLGSTVTTWTWNDPRPQYRIGVMLFGMVQK